MYIASPGDIYMKRDLVQAVDISIPIKKAEYFHFNQTYLLEGFDFEHFKNMVKKDYIVVDFRMFYRPNGSVRNHGTGFRVKINQLYNCFDKKLELV